MKKNYLLFYPFLFFVSLLALSSCSFSPRTTKRLFDKASVRTYDIIVVPGGTYHPSGWDSILKGRVYWSKFLYDKGIAKNIMYSGSSVASPYYEGEIMKMYAIAIGIPAEHIFTELKAEHSTENLYYSYHKAKKLGFDKIALATDPYQAKQLRSFAKLRISRDIDIIPIIFDTLRAMQSTMTNPVIDHQMAYNDNFVPLKTRESFWKRLKGTMGKNIDHGAYK
ncbi:MAG TPA: YdcF family protein [Ferruginibacter sp.]|nr:YdcF family protein [Ferruginibacter sp.]